MRVMGVRVLGLRGLEGDGLGSRVLHVAVSWGNQCVLLSSINLSEGPCIYIFLYIYIYIYIYITVSDSGSERPSSLWLWGLIPLLMNPLGQIVSTVTTALFLISSVVYLPSFFFVCVCVFILVCLGDSPVCCALSLVTKELRRWLARVSRDPCSSDCLQLKRPTCFRVPGSGFYKNSGLKG